MKKDNEDVRQLFNIAVSKFNDTVLDIVKLVSTEYIAPIFDQYSFVNQISWTQYTDYWNDGEPCHFYAPRGIYVYIAGAEKFHYEDLDCGDVKDILEDVLYPDSSDLHSKEIDDIVEQLGFCLDTLHSVLEDCGSVLKVIGDHTEVIVDRVGIVTLLDYTDHD